MPTCQFPSLLGPPRSGDVHFAGNPRDLVISFNEQVDRPVSPSSNPQSTDPTVRVSPGPPVTGGGPSVSRRSFPTS